MTPIAPHMSAYLNDYLVGQRAASQHTRDTYAYAFKLLFEFASKRLEVRPSDLYLEQIDAPLVVAFLEHLETARGNTPSTRNNRLAAIKAFFRFLEHRLPSAMEQIRRVLAIPTKKTDTRLVPYLSSQETDALLNAPDPSTRAGLRDRAMLVLALTAGLRVSELVGLRMDDLTLQPSPTIHVRGKGRRERVLPLLKETASALRAWLRVRGDVSVPEVFVNARGQQLSRWGVEHILKKHLATARDQCPSLLNKPVSPHVLRHTCAMVVLQATGDIRKVALWLGHSNIQTTEVYTRTDPTEKLEAITAITPLKLRKGLFRPPDKLIALLKGRSLCGVNTPGNPPPDGLPRSQLPITDRST
jgi:site-specific recombinase XerD